MIAARTRGRCLAGKLQRRGIHPVRGAAKGEFAQCKKVWFAKEPLCRGSYTISGIHFPGLQTGQQIVGRQVDDFNFIRFVEYAIRERFMLTHTDDAGDDVVQAFEMLNIQRGPDADAGV
jgi:hypothetical protein